MKLEPGTTIGRYTVEEMVGEGGMACVYRVRHNELHATYALKVLNLVSDAIQRRLVQEGRVQARLRHPNILPVTDILQIDGRPGLVMEYVAGPSLEIHLATRHLPLDEADDVAQGILSAVAFAHSQGCVHRDLKPANILMSDIGGEFIPKVADFGLVKLIGEGNDSLHKTRSGIGIGTPCYMAPEQALDAAHVDERADIFSLGAILYELVCGRRAFHGPNTVAIILRIAAGDFQPPEELRPDLPERMLNAIHGAMQIDRKLRIQDLKTLRAVWRGKQRWEAPRQPSSDATWSDDGVLASSDPGLAGLQDIIRSIAAKPASKPPAPSSQPAPVADPPIAPTLAAPSMAPATAVPPEPTVPPPPRLPTMDPEPVHASGPDPAPASPSDSGTLADDAALELDAGVESVSEALLTADPELRPIPPPPAPVPVSIEPSAPPKESPEEDDRRGLGMMPKLMAAAGLLAALGIGGVIVVVLAIAFLPGSEDPTAETPADELTSLAAVIEQPEVAPGSDEATEEGDEAATTTEQPEEPAVIEAEPAAPAEPEPQPTVAKAPAPIRTGTVNVSGDMVSVALISETGRRRPPGVIPVGTYDLEVGFANGKLVTRTDMVVVTSGGTVSIRCSSRVENCR